jgi:UDP-glucose 4-epimerase
MKIWVTGAKGFIGGYLARELANCGHEVHGIGHGALEDPEKHRLGIQVWLNGEIDGANLNTLASRGGLPDLAFHLAGGSSVGLSISQPYEEFSRTVIGTAKLLEWLRSCAPECRLISISSAAVYGANHKGPIPKDGLTLPMSPYGQHKLIMEQLCRSYGITFGLRSTIVRLFSVYGPHLRKQLLWDLCSRLNKGERTIILGGTGAERRDWTDVRDVVKLLVKMIDWRQSEPHEIINGGSGVGTPVAQIAELLIKNWGGNLAFKFSGVVREGDPFSLVSDLTSGSGPHFDWQIPVEQGLADYVSWFKRCIH